MKFYYKEVKINENFSSLSDIKKSDFKDKNLAVALGTFDGVHLGHQKCHL